MATKTPESTPGHSLAAIATPLPEARQDSVISSIPINQTSKEMTAQALDHIHSTASQSTCLTTFNDFASPPKSSGLVEKDRSNLGNLYGKLRASVTSARPSQESSDALDAIPDSKRLKDSTFATNKDHISEAEAQRPAESQPVPPLLAGLGVTISSDASIDVRSDRLEHRDPTSVLQIQQKANSGPNSQEDSQARVELGSEQTYQNSAAKASNQTVSSGLQSKAASIAEKSNVDSTTSLGGTGDLPSVASREVSHGRRNVQAPEPTISHSPSLEHVSGRNNVVAPSLVSSRGRSTPSRQRSGSPDSISWAQPAHRSGLQPLMPHERLSGTSTPRASVHRPRKKQLISKEFWMKDENARICFYCGDSFSTFRRKHHCRMCGQIYDAKCTTLLPGKLFGQAGTIRVCINCQSIANAQADSSEDSDDYDVVGKFHRVLNPALEHEPFGHHMTPSTRPVSAMGGDGDFPESPRSNATSSRFRDSRRRYIAIVEPDVRRDLTRPSSSRSLKSMAGRPRSASHKHHNSHLQHMKSLRMGHDDSVPFRRLTLNDQSQHGSLPAFHTDSIIDPDLAPFMSDEDSSDDDTASLHPALNDETHEQGNFGLGNIFGVLRRTKSHHTQIRGLTPGTASRDPDAISIASSRVGRTRRPTKSRTLSLGSIYGPSPRLKRADHSINGNRVADDALVDPAHLDTVDQYLNPVTEMHRDVKYKPSGELNAASLAHIKILLRQSLYDARIEHVSHWEMILNQIAFKCATNLNLSLQRNDSIDIRQYIKLKKVPGGKPSDTAYVSGVVFTGNIALKRMRRSIKNPRLLLVSFPILYARHQNHFMSLEPIIAQEREYLRKLVDRIMALQPNVLVASQPISGLALQFLQDAGVSVICNVKESVLHAISRCARGRIVPSVDRLSTNPALVGTCSNFDVKILTSQTLKKSYVYLSGCQRDLGCTIVLRGADTETLRTVKHLTEFMCYITYNLKLETSLLRDAFVLLAPPEGQQLPRHRQDSLLALANPSKAPKEPLKTAEKSGNAISINKAGAKESSARNDGVERSAVNEKAATNPTENKADSLQSYAELLKELRVRVLSSSPSVNFEEPYLLRRGHDQETQVLQLRHLRARDRLDDSIDEKVVDSRFELVRPEMVYDSVQSTSHQVREVIRAIHDAEYERTLHRYDTLRRRWEIFLASSEDPFSPFTHQKIVVLFSLVSIPTLNVCAGADLLALEFYQEHSHSGRIEPDVPLGEYIESLCLQAETGCITGRCELPMHQHRRQYVHGDGQLSVTTEKMASRLPGMENSILMWSICKLCGHETPVTPMSSNTWKYSFGKYLELSFWSRPLHPRAGLCRHDVFREHDRYFGFRGVVLRIRYEPINLMEVIVPRATITWKVDKDLHLKNAQYEKIEGRLTRFMISVKERLAAINIENIEPENSEACEAEIERLLKKVDEDLKFLQTKLQEKYMTSKFYENIPLNRAVRAMQEKVAEWDATFFEFERSFLPSDKDLRAMVTQQLRKMYLNREESGGSMASGDNTAMMEKQSINTEPTDQDSSHSQLDGQRHSHTGSESNMPAVPSQDVVHQLDLATPLPAEDKVEAMFDPSGEVTSKSKQPQSEESKMPLQHEESPMPSPEAPRDSEAEPKRSPSRTGRPPKIGIRPTPPLLRSKTQPDSILRPTVNKAIQSSLGLTMTPMVPPKALNTALLVSPTKSDKDDRSSNSSGNRNKLQKPSMIPRAVPSKRQDSRVSALAKHFEQLSREFERERLRERRHKFTRNRLRAFPTASSKPVVEIYNDAHEAVNGTAASDEDEESVEAHRLEHKVNAGHDNNKSRKSSGATTDLVLRSNGLGNRQVEQLQAEESAAEESHPTSDIEGGLSEPETFSDVRTADEDDERASLTPSESTIDLSLDMAKHEKSSLMKMLTSFWSERTASGWAPLEYPMVPTDHIFADSDVIVREDEPSSLIAFSLASPDYRSKMNKFRDRIKGPERRQALDQTGALDGEDPEVEGILLGETATHLKYQFDDQQASMHCKVFYSESFDAIRRKCGVADRFVESLSRCFKWDSKGGKTKSLFLKTLDERFVLKSLSQVEVQAFLKFAPDYFHYISETLFHSLPSAIAKILGFYQVVIKNPATGTTFTHFLQVMENVFYEGVSSRMFDLKGSMRNRRIESTGEENEVLLDENLLDYVSQSPVYVRNHSNNMLAQSIQNDTLFCSKQNVMDYSLVVGLYDDRKELVVGVIDYIRTYTWDKKLESMIKDRGSKHRATVREPRKYRARFRESIARYFPLAPSCWHVLPSQRVEHAKLQLVIAALGESEPLAPPPSRVVPPDEAPSHDDDGEEV